jgi:hypothetical protein
MGIREHVAELERYLGREPDIVVVNTTPIPESLLHRYAVSGEAPVLFNYETSRTRVVPADLLANEVIVTTAGDVLKRSLIRHDPRKLARTLMNIIRK